MNLRDLFDFTHAAGNRHSWYTKVLLGKEKVEHNLVLIKGADFLNNCYIPVDIENEPLLCKTPLEKRKPNWGIPWIDLYRKKAKGRGRTLVCHRNGIKWTPLLIVGDIKKWLKETSVKVREPET